jgi:hypothetical protein
MESFSLITMIFVILTWVTVMKILKDMKKEFEEIKQKINMKSE